MGIQDTGDERLTVADKPEFVSFQAIHAKAGLQPVDRMGRHMPGKPQRGVQGLKAVIDFVEQGVEGNRGICLFKHLLNQLAGMYAGTFPLPGIG